MDRDRRIFPAPLAVLRSGRTPENPGECLVSVHNERDRHKIQEEQEKHDGFGTDRFRYPPIKILVRAHVATWKGSGDRVPFYLVKSGSAQVYFK